MGTSNEAAKAEAAKVPQRSPSCPVISLQAAIARVEKLFKLEGKTLVHHSVAVGHWGFSSKSSGGRQLISTLLQYALLRDEGSGDKRSLAVSTLGMDILLLEEDSPSRYEALRIAAKSPKLFADILASYSSGGLPSDASLKRFLIMERHVGTDLADDVVKNFRDTVFYAKLFESPTERVADKSPAVLKGTQGDVQKPEVGDLIQWEAGGALKLEAPRRVRAIQEAEGNSWVFVEGSDTGIPMNETSVIERATKAQAVAPVLPEGGATVRTSAVEREWLRGPLSKETNYRLIVTGDLGSREIGKLIKLLEAQKLVLDDDD